MPSKKRELSAFEQQIQEYVRESDAISGIEYAPESDYSKRHLDIALVLTNRPYKLVSPILVNHALMDASTEVLRVNTEFTQRGLVPHATKVGAYLAAWEREVSLLLESKDMLLPAHLSKECWDMHHKLVCLLPFKVATSRTARLMLLHIRTLLSLPFVVIKNDDAESYYAQLSAFREHVFLPALRAEQLAHQ